MATYEFIRKENLNGEVFYYTEKDGGFVDNSLDMDKEKALEKYRKICEGKDYPILQTLEKFETND